MLGRINSRSLKEKEALQKSSQFEQNLIATRKEIDLNFKEHDIVKKIIDALASDNTNRAIKLLNKTEQPEVIASSVEIQKSVGEALARKMTKFGFNMGSTMHIVHSFNLSREIIANSVEQWLCECQYFLIERANYIKQQLDLSEDEIINIGKRVAQKLVSNGDVGKILTIQKEFKISDEVFTDPEFKKAAIDGMAISYDQENSNKMIKIKNDFKVPDQVFHSSEFRKVAKKRVISKLSHGEVETAIQIIEEFNLDEDAISYIDKTVAKNSYYKSYLIKFIPVLGNNDLWNIFPQTFDKIIICLSEENYIGYEDLADYFLENLNKYYTKEWVAKIIEKAIEHYSIANKFLNACENKTELWLNEIWVKDILAKAKKIVIEKNDLGKEGFLDQDPFRNKPYFGIQSSVTLGEIMSGKTIPQESGLELSAKAIEALQEINSIIEKEHTYFLNNFKNNSSVEMDDKTALLDQKNSNVRMNNLLPNVRNLIARYLVQLSCSNESGLSETIILQKKKINTIVEEGYRRYLQVYEYDIPLYDKLYEEFDYWREAGRYPMEVYLGRDGIYAYIGRRAQDSARRSKIGKTKMQELRAQGEVIEINPKYLVYPRYFRDFIDYKTKRLFLEQERISPEMDPLFYDTGYTGTIPEQIMKVMDFDQDDIDNRIRLLSAPSAKRRVKGIPENARSEIIEHIEHNAKTENTAVGLIIDEETGKIRHVAESTEPEEQFYFMMIKQAIVRHYFVKERLHYEPYRTINMDSEHYGIRIVQEYAQRLPAEFVSNPKQYFKTHGTLLKGSKGEGEFPDEEIILFTLDDGTEVVAKRIELRKAKEAKKEFMILIAAKKSGLSTAEPIGFLSGKEENDGSYLLMEKLEGVSGRNFYKYLEKLGKFTRAKMLAIMEVITQKLEEQAKLYREKLNIDKHWRVKDTIIQFNEESGEVENVIPIDWERAKAFDPDKPQKIDSSNQW